MLIDEFITLRRMPTGRHTFSLNQMRDRADAAGLPDVVHNIDEALAIAGTAQAKDLQWERTRSQGSKARGKSAKYDLLLDQQIVAIEKKVASETVGERSDPIVILAKSFLNDLFSGGSIAITQNDFEVQLGIMENMQKRFQGDLADAVLTLGLTRQVDRFDRLLALFRAELTADHGPEITFDKVRSTRDKLHRAVCKVVGALFFLLDGEDEATLQTRNHILAPLMDQQERVASARRRRRAVTDVDPATGDELFEPIDGFEEIDTAEPELVGV